MHHIKSKGYRSYIYVVALTVLFMFIVGCEEKTMDKYRMDKADENTYELSGIQDVSLMNNSVYAASGNSIYRTTFDDVTDMSGKLCEADSEITALSSSEDRLWYSCADGTVAGRDYETGETSVYDVFQDGADVTFLSESKGKILLINRESGQMYWKTSVYLYDTANGTLEDLTNTFLPEGEYVAAGFIGGKEMYFVYNNIPSSDFTTFLTTDSKDISTTKKIGGPFYNCEYLLSSNKLCYVRSGSIYEYDIKDDYSTLIGAVDAELVNKIFVSASNIITFSKSSSILEVTVIPDAANTIKVILPDDSGDSVLYSKLRMISENLKARKGVTLEIVTLAEKGYLDHLRLMLLDKDASFDLYCVPDGRDEQILRTLTDYGLYHPLNEYGNFAEFMENELYDHMRSSLSDKNGNIFALPLNSSVMVFWYGNGYDGERRQTFTFDDFYGLCDKALGTTDTSVFWDEHSSEVLFDHLLSQLIEQDIPENSADEIEKFLSVMRKLSSAGRLSGEKCMFDIPMLFTSLGGGMNLGGTSDICAFPSLTADDAVVPCVNTDLIFCSPYSKKTDTVDKFIGYLLDEYIYNANYFNGLIGRSTEKYKDQIGRQTFDDASAEVYSEISFPDAYTQMFKFDELSDIYNEAVYGGADIKKSVSEITDIMKKRMFE